MTKKVKIPFQISVRDLSVRLDIEVSDLIAKLIENGLMATINDTLDYDTAAIIAEDFGFEAETDDKTTDDNIINVKKLEEILKLEKENDKNLKKRPPVVTILGHVDHGKTTLLDTLKKTRIADKEFGGITQHINAYQIKKKNDLITFIDTPGHEAFQSMRERGASIADIAILVVAADDGVKPQTREVIEFLNKHKIPTIVAINKIDKETANPNKARQELAEAGILVEGYGGTIPVCEISAKNNIGLDELLDTILLLAEINEFKANQDRDALGLVLEAHKDKEKGPVATILIKTGKLKLGHDITVGNIEGKIRKIEDYAGKNLEIALPSTPVTIFGLSAVPKSNDVLQVQEGHIGRKKRKILQRLGKKTSKVKSLSSSDFIKDIDQALLKKYPIILKTDVQGTLEAVKQILSTIDSSEVQLDIFREDIGMITENDIQIAQTGENTVIYGFNTKASPAALRMAEKLNVEIKTFKIIYELVATIKEEMSELLEPEIKRTDLGRLKILAIFKNLKKGMVVGGEITNGKFVKGEFLEVIRNKEVIGKGKLTQLQHNKQEVSEVKTGLECGFVFEGKVKILVDDKIVCYKEEQIKRKL